MAREPPGTKHSLGGRLPVPSAGLRAQRAAPLLPAGPSRWYSPPVAPGPAGSGQTAGHAGLLTGSWEPGAREAQAWAHVCTCMHSHATLTHMRTHAGQETQRAFSEGP